MLDEFSKYNGNGQISKQPSRSIGGELFIGHTLRLYGLAAFLQKPCIWWHWVNPLTVFSFDSFESEAKTSSFKLFWTPLFLVMYSEGLDKYHVSVLSYPLPVVSANVFFHVVLLLPFILQSSTQIKKRTSLPMSTTLTKWKELANNMSDDEVRKSATPKMLITSLKKNMFEHASKEVLFDWKKME